MHRILQQYIDRVVGELQHKPQRRELFELLAPPSVQQAADSAEANGARDDELRRFWVEMYLTSAGLHASCHQFTEALSCISSATARAKSISDTSVRGLMRGIVHLRSAAVHDLAGSHESYRRELGNALIYLPPEYLHRTLSLLMSCIETPSTAAFPHP